MYPMAQTASTSFQAGVWPCPPPSRAVSSSLLAPLWPNPLCLRGSAALPFPEAHCLQTCAGLVPFVLLLPASGSPWRSIRPQPGVPAHPPSPCLTSLQRLLFPFTWIGSCALAHLPFWAVNSCRTGSTEDLSAPPPELTQPLLRVSVRGTVAERVHERVSEPPPASEQLTSWTWRLTVRGACWGGGRGCPE